jgi:hypothetical protein
MFVENFSKINVLNIKHQLENILFAGCFNF